MRRLSIPPVNNLRFFRLPNSMKANYIQCKLEHLYPRLTLRYILRKATGTILSPALLKEAERSQTVKIMHSQLKAGVPSGTQFDEELIFLYCLVRLVAPEKVLETGVANGSSTCAILEAMRCNGKGTLYSIDLVFKQDAALDCRLSEANIKMEDCTTIPCDKEPGWLVPHEWRDRWEFIEGDSLEEMPKLLMSTGPIDIFFHDSVHTEAHMLQEFRIVYPHLREGGLLLADDIFIRDHDAIAKFALINGFNFYSYLEIGIVPKKNASR